MCEHPIFFRMKTSFSFLLMVFLLPYQKMAEAAYFFSFRADSIAGGSSLSWSEFADANCHTHKKKNMSFSLLYMQFTHIQTVHRQTFALRTYDGVKVM